MEALGIWMEECKLKDGIKQILDKYINDGPGRMAHILSDPVLYSINVVS